MKIASRLSSILFLLFGFHSLVNAVEMTPAKDCTSNEYLSMDGNKDGVLSKQEFMKYQEQHFDKIKQKDGMLSLKKIDKESNNNSMNHKAIGTTTDNPNVNDKDAVNGSKY
jgi:hypothetical protein